MIKKVISLLDRRLEDCFLHFDDSKLEFPRLRLLNDDHEGLPK